MKLNIITSTMPFIPKSSQIKEYQDKFIEMCKTVKGDIYAGPEYLFAPQKPYTEQQKNQILQRFKDISEGKLIMPGTIAWTPDNQHWMNTLYAIADGEIIHQYSKETDSTDSHFYKDFKYGTVKEQKNTKNVFDWRDLKIGTEICRDHGHGRLKKYMEKNAINSVDMQVILANNGTLSKKQFGIRDSGLVMLVDGTDEQTITTLTNKQNNIIYKSDQNQNYEIHEVVL